MSGAMLEDMIDELISLPDGVYQNIVPQKGKEKRKEKRKEKEIEKEKVKGKETEKESDING